MNAPRPNPRRVAFDVLREVTGKDAYANLALAKRLVTADLDRRDAGFVTELVSGTCRLMGTYDLVIEAASGRALGSLQPAVVDLLRLGSHQLLGMEMAPHAAVGATVELARKTVGQRVTGIVNAVLRKVSKRSLAGWSAHLAEGQDETGALAITQHHPRWIVEAYAEVLPQEEARRGARGQQRRAGADARGATRAGRTLRTVAGWSRPHALFAVRCHGIGSGGRARRAGAPGRSAG